MFKIGTAQRENVKLKIGVAGPSGSGKTYSSLLLAYGIAGDWKKVAVADTENKSAAYYAHLGPWQHIPFDPKDVPEGYHPKNWVSLIGWVETAQPEIEVLILDSISHEWEGQGGCLELVDKIGKGGNSFTAWKSVTPLHNRFIDSMRQSPLHIIATMRTKQDYVLETNEKGKQVPKKVGLKSITREGMDYEMGIVFETQMNHFAITSKDRTGLFMPRGEFQLTPGIGKELVEWANSGNAVPEPPVERYEAKPDQKKTLMAHALKHGFTKDDGDQLKKLSEELQGIDMKHLEAAVVEWRGNHGLANAAV